MHEQSPGTRLIRRFKSTGEMGGLTQFLNGQSHGIALADVSAAAQQHVAHALVQVFSKFIADVAPRCVGQAHESRHHAEPRIDRSAGIAIARQRVQRIDGLSCRGFHVWIAPAASPTR
jgi:hypothetical protein